MPFAEFWDKLVTKKPKLAEPDSEVTIKAGEFRKLLEAAWQSGWRTGRNGKSVFEQVFGVRRP
jgi:hypothetical protein